MYKVVSERQGPSSSVRILARLGQDSSLLSLTAFRLWPLPGTEPMAQPGQLPENTVVPQLSPPVCLYFKAPLQPTSSWTPFTAPPGNWWSTLGYTAGIFASCLPRSTVKNGLCRPRRPETQMTQEEKAEDLKVEMSQEQVNRFGSYPALASKKNGKWEVLNYNQYYEACRKTARAMLKLGLEPFHSVGILGFNSTEWVLAALGAIFAGGFCVGIYATNFADACEYVITHAKVNILLVENNAQLQKILSVTTAPTPPPPAR
ncbi:hypothetical protein MJT46_006795 [Ovis ammon polii x Ovis aries]|nr:hypothetical protein MJT46_006795 [Ovis ammon polii x Ovis aries]